MAKTLVQKVLFKDTSPKELYELYLNARKHSRSTGSPADISNKEGTHFTAHDGHITGQNLKLVKDSLIVQSWRARDWKQEDPDSTLTIHLEPKGKNTVLHAVHSNIPDDHADGIDKGWQSHYWEPWKAYLAGKRATKTDKN